jgi:predicted nucleotide-binding protein
LQQTHMQQTLKDEVSELKLEVSRLLEGTTQSGRLARDRGDVRYAAGTTFGSTSQEIRVFIGHGHSEFWKSLKAHLGELHKYETFSWESRPWAGYSTAEAVEAMLDHATFAILVHTAEDETADDRMRARQNVIHETGLFQAKLGLKRTIILREEGCEPFSNLTGVQEIAFGSAGIEVAFGEVVATIRREFDIEN